MKTTRYSAISRSFYALALSLLTVSATTAFAQQPIVYGAPISSDKAKHIAAAAIAEAKKQKLTVAVSIVDSSGTLTYFEKIDGTQHASADIATAKAVSANHFKRSTKLFEDSVAGGRHAVLGLPGVVPIEGGLPIIEGNQVIGAIGVSGASSAEDGQIAQAAINSRKP